MLGALLRALLVRGSSRSTGRTRQWFVTCRWCGGSGRQIRVGARVFHRTLASRRWLP
jgi:hypothetical protein